MNQIIYFILGFFGFVLGFLFSEIISFNKKRISSYRIISIIGTGLITIFIILLVIWFNNSIEFLGPEAIFNFTIADFATSMSTVVLGIITFSLAYTQAENARKNREVERIKTDLHKIYQPIMNIFEDSVEDKEDFFIKIYKYERLVSIIQSFNYRLPENLKDILPKKPSTAELKRDISRYNRYGSGIEYRFSIDRYELLRDQYNKLQNRFDELTIT